MCALYVLLEQDEPNIPNVRYPKDVPMYHECHIHKLHDVPCKPSMYVGKQ